jgi:hypothetical protein
MITTEELFFIRKFSVFNKTLLPRAITTLFRVKFVQATVQRKIVILD